MYVCVYVNMYIYISGPSAGGDASKPLLVLLDVRMPGVRSNGNRALARLSDNVDDNIRDNSNNNNNDNNDNNIVVITNTTTNTSNANNDNDNYNDNDDNSNTIS